MELGNLCFGNSRGNYAFPNRDIVNSKEWNELLSLINVDTYGYSLDSDEIIFKFIKNKEVVFTIMPYYWGDCTCGAEKNNQKLYDKLLKECFTEEEKEIYESYEEICDFDCPAFEDDDKTNEELLKICNCGCVEKNIELNRKKELIKNKVINFENKYREKEQGHGKDCKLIQHNFMYHPGKEDEFWIEWYKYPFRDSYMNKNLSENEILEIFKNCINVVKSKKENK